MLYLVPTPVGNLQDITLRALDVLREVDLILCEDTRVSRRLLQKYDIGTALQSFHSHSEHKKLSGVIEKLQNGEKIALISDAGTPGISDPGYLLAAACHEHDIQLTCLPGASAILPALVMSGLPCNRFYFEGFLPQKKGRQTRLQYLASLDCTIALYESPYRVVKCLQQLSEHFDPATPAAVVKEISKMYETVYRGSLAELIEQSEDMNLKGEFVIVLAPQMLS